MSKFLNNENTPLTVELLRMAFKTAKVEVSKRLEFVFVQGLKIFVAILTGAPIPIVVEISTSHPCVFLGSGHFAASKFFSESYKREALRDMAVDELLEAGGKCVQAAFNAEPGFCGCGLDCFATSNGVDYNSLAWRRMVSRVEAIAKGCAAWWSITLKPDVPQTSGVFIMNEGTHAMPGLDNKYLNSCWVRDCFGKEHLLQQRTKTLTSPVKLRSLAAFLKPWTTIGAAAAAAAGARFVFYYLSSRSRLR